MQFLALDLSAVTDAGDVEFAGETLLDAGDHVLHEGARQAVQCTRDTLFRRTRHNDRIAFDGNLDLRVRLEGELALGAFNLQLAIVHDDFDVLWNFDSFFADAGHVGTSAF